MQTNGAMPSVQQDDDTYYIPVRENGTAEVILRWPTAQAVRRVVLKEQILKSQRIEHFAIDAWQNGHWQPVAENTVVGYKRIVFLGKVETSALRIRILDARVAPTLKFLGVYA